MFNQLRLQFRGRGHIRSNTPCQDATYYDSDGSVQAISLADGAGSERFSGYGAQIITQKACRYLVENFRYIYDCKDGVRIKTILLEYLRSSLEEKKAKLRSKPDKADCELKNLASTFLTVAVCGNEFILAHIGDGVIGYAKHGGMKVATAPDNDEFANLTTFVTSANAIDAMRLVKGILDGISGFILMSDGTANSLYNSRTGELSNACAELIDAVAQSPPNNSKRHNKIPNNKNKIKQLFEIRIREKTNDDCSVAIIARKRVK